MSAGSRLKVRASGPMVQLMSAPLAASLSSSFSSPLNRDDWAAGRCLIEEERRCGMVAHLSGDVPSKALHAPSAVVKAQASDFQSNEIDAAGAMAVLERRPKGRWRKVSRPHTILVENTSAPFSDPEKSYSPLLLHHGEYVRAMGRLPSDTPVLRFAMYNDGYSLESVLQRFQYEIGVQRDAVYLHSTPGGHSGCSTHIGTCVGVTKEQLPHVSRHYNLHPLLFDSHHYHSIKDLAKLTAPPQGHFYRLMLRCVESERAEVESRLRLLKERGFINYFGLEHFWVGSNALFDLAAHAFRGDFRTAIGTYLQTLAEADPFHFSSFSAYINADDSTTVGILDDWCRKCSAARVPREVNRVMTALRNYHAGGCTDVDLSVLWDSVPVHTRSRRSAAQFVWNAMASQRILCGDGGKAMVGDIVRGTPASADVASEFKTIKNSEEARLYTIADVVLPVPYEETNWECACFPSEGPVSRELYETFTKRHHVGFLFDNWGQRTQSEAPVVYRHLVAKPMRMEAAVMHDPSSLSCLKSDLFLLQERKPVNSLALDYHTRVREPCVYNVSERFAEKMHAVRRGSPRGENTVALSFILPNDESPLVALRDTFSLKHVAFNDLNSVY